MAPTDSTPGLELSEIGWVALKATDEYSSCAPFVEELEHVAPGTRAGIEQAHGDAQGLPAAGAVPEDAAGHLDRRSTVAAGSSPIPDPGR